MIRKKYAIRTNIQSETHKVLQSDSTQTFDHIQKCFRQKFQFSRRPSYWTTLFFIGGGAEAMKIKYENSRKIETYRNNHFQRIHTNLGLGLPTEDARSDYPQLVSTC